MFKNEEGFSLLELVVAVGVAGIIAAVALPTFSGIQSHATSTSATYAASASAAEALANSTIGNTGSASSNGGSTASSSTTTASSSSTGNTANFSVALLVDQQSNGGGDFVGSGSCNWASGNALTFYCGMSQTALNAFNAISTGSIVEYTSNGVAYQFHVETWNYSNSVSFVEPIPSGAGVPDAGTYIRIAY